jgi:nucleoid-associated protein YgaU
MVRIKHPKSLAVVALALLIYFSLIVPSYAVENGSIGGRPARPRDDNPRSQSIFVHEIEAGNSVDEAVLLVNNSDVEKTILVYPVDSQIASGGTFTCAQKLDLAVGVGTWIELEEERVVLGPNSTKEVPFKINVPKTASPGEQNGCIAVQAEEPPQATQQDGVTLSFRSAIRVAITVPGEITKELSFIGPVAVRQESNNIRLSVGLKNNGNVSLDADVAVEIKSLLGGTIRRNGGEYPVLSGNELILNFETKPPFWGGWYRVEGRASFASDITRSLGEGGELDTIGSPSHIVFVKPQPAAIVIVLVALIAMVGASVWVLRRRRYYKKLHMSAKEYRVKKTDTLQKIATKHNLSWKEIAKINKLKAPYHVEPGTLIKLPVKQQTETTTREE